LAQNLTARLCVARTGAKTILDNSFWNMASRLGEVFYWTASGLAALVVLGVIALLIQALIEGANFDIEALVGGLVIALLIWLAGRACLYVLAGR
jgi:hypothetical protein